MSDAIKTTILVVEDEILVRMLGTDILEEAGFEVLEAGDADEALDLLKRHDEVRLLFSDIDLPGSMNGLELAALVHRLWPGIGLLITSGNHQVSQEALPDHGRFVRKPRTQDALIAKVRDTLTV